MEKGGFSEIEYKISSQLPWFEWAILQIRKIHGSRQIRLEAEFSASIGTRPPFKDQGKRHMYLLLKILAESSPIKARWLWRFPKKRDGAGFKRFHRNRFCQYLQAKMMRSNNVKTATCTVLATEIRHPELQNYEIETARMWTHGPGGRISVASTVTAKRQVVESHEQHQDPLQLTFPRRTQPNNYRSNATHTFAGVSAFLVLTPSSIRTQVSASIWTFIKI